MIAVDTNVLVRLIVQDDADQFKRARRLVEENDIYITKTVLLEIEWVLRGVYEKPRHDVMDALGRLAGLPTVTLEDPGAVRAALHSKLDFADALHLASAGSADRFATFDRALIRAATQMPIEVFEP